MEMFGAFFYRIANGGKCKEKTSVEE